jgi:SAM-dependent methyltransferase
MCSHVTVASADKKNPNFVNNTAEVGYNNQAGAYPRGRPAYHPAVVERAAALHRTLPTSGLLLVELGAGTGIFTAQLVEHVLADDELVVTAVEPVAAMRSALSEALPDVAVVSGTAEQTGLPDHCAATVIASQSFHWFNHGDLRPNALDEIARILVPGGHLITVWNVRDNTVDWVRAYTEVVDRHAGDTPRHHTMAWRRAIDGDHRFDNVEDVSFDNPSATSPQGVLDRVMSTSFIAALAPEEAATVQADIAAIVEPLGTTFDYPYVSELQAWRRTAGG